MSTSPSQLGSITNASVLEGSVKGQRRCSRSGEAVIYYYGSSTMPEGSMFSRRNVRDAETFLFIFMKQPVLLPIIVHLRKYS
jgi:hypothetical protein